MTFAVRAQDSSPRIQTQQTDTVLVIDGKDLVARQKIWKLAEDPGTFERTVRSYRLMNTDGDSLYSRSFTAPEVSEHGFNAVSEVFLSSISATGRQGLLVYTAGYPSAPNTGVDMQLFVWQGDSILPLAPPFDIYGDFGEFSREGLDEAGKLSDSEVVLRNHHANHYFYLEIPVIVNLDLETNKHFRTGLEKDPESGLSIFPVSAERRPGFMDESPAEIRLYGAPSGAGYQAVAVDKTSDIRIIEAYGTATVEQSSEGMWVSYNVQRLKVEINGQVGFVEKQAYRKIGLPVFG